MDERELELIFEKLRDGVDLTAEEMRKLQGDSNAFGKALKENAKTIGRSFATLAGTVAQGNNGFRQLNPVVDGVVGALGEMAKAIPFAGNAVSGSLKLVAEGAKFLLDQLEVSTKAFQDLGKIGGLTAQGMSGLQQQFLRSGLTLQDFQKQVTNNAGALARFAGNVGKGAEDFATITGSIIDSGLGDELRRIGFTADDIGEATAGFITQQTRLGLAQTKTQQQLINGSKKYAEELDILAKLTGMSRQDVQRQQDAALSEARFRATVDELVANNQEGAAKALLDFQTRLSAFPEVAQGLRDLSSGFTTTDAAVKLLNTSAGQAPQIIDDLKNGLISQDEATRRLQESLRSTLGTTRPLAKAIGDSSGAFIAFNQQSDIVNATLQDGVLIAKRTQDAQKSGTDDLTNTTVNAQKQLEQMSRNINNLAFAALPAASSAVEGFTSVLNQGIAKISSSLGVKPIVTPSGAPRPGAAAGAAPGTVPTGQQQLSQAGLKLKTGDVQKEGAGVSPRLIELARRIQNEIPGFQYFSAFNDKYHNERGSRSAHTRGAALDFTLAGAPSREQGAAILSTLKNMGFSTAYDEYNFPSRGSTGGHFHAEISAAQGGVFAGPRSGYAATLHGTEAVVPLPDGKSIPVQSASSLDSQAQISMLGAQLTALENLVSAMRDQNSISSKILQATVN